MIKTLLVGAALGIMGKKLFDEGKLDPYIAQAKAKLDQLGLAGGNAKSKSTGGEPGRPISGEAVLALMAFKRRSAMEVGDQCGIVRSITRI